MDDQAASMDPAAEKRRRAARLRKSDPEMASLEVAQVLAQVRGRSPSPQSIPDMLSERSHRVDGGGSYGGIDQHIYEDSDVDVVEKVPRVKRADRSLEDRSSEGADDEDDELMAPILNARQMAKEQRRLGYFDLHPERRPAQKPSTPPSTDQHEEDPRDRFARNSMSEEGVDDDDTNASSIQPEPRRPLPPPPLVSVSPLVPSKASTPPRAVPDIKIVTEAPVTPEKPKLSPPNPNGNAVDGLPKPRTPTGGSRTAALIEMYREKERGSAASPAAIHVPTIPVAPLNISRIPVRNASLPAQPAPAAAAVPLPSLPVASLTPSPTPSPKPSPPQPTDFVPPPPIDDPSLGRASPARYVHGAPLHNVLEEEEEEE